MHSHSCSYIEERNGCAASVETWRSEGFSEKEWVYIWEMEKNIVFLQAKYTTNNGFHNQ